MHILRSLDELSAWRAAHCPCVLVPTMGNLHAGHLALIERARTLALPVISSLFVNPLQFGPGEDYKRYPRTFDADRSALEAAACDALFAPEAATLYPYKQTYRVWPPALADDLCGAHRPGHFDGVLTVVLKLFNLVQPAAAVFGKKDYQQLALIAGMVREFNLPIRLLAGETVRQSDGLALSSRNAYLDAAARTEAPRLAHLLREAASQLASGRRDYARIESATRDTLVRHGWRVDYIAIRDPALSEPGPGETDFVVLGAARLGDVRLIDNLEVGDPAAFPYNHLSL
jgi:pantoate--beta-alanine ligase